VFIAISMMLSWFIAWYEISTGKKRGHPSIVADGKETLSDSFVELTVLGGIVGIAMGLPYLDYIIGIAVSVIY